MSKTHKVKLHERYFEDVGSKIKNAEVRYNDRDYKVGDWLVLEEWTGTEYTGRYEIRKIKSIYPLDEIGIVGYVLICLE